MSAVEKNKTVTLMIDGKECVGEWGQTILQIARANDIYIPTMCYLSKVEPIASCRMCVVEVEGVDGMILSCQEKAVDRAVITTNSADLYRERQNITKLYDVNHPLECGVCDKSGECDLQNQTIEFGVDQQTFTARDQHRPVQDWGFISYDPALCIMCEKCVHVCNEIVGDEALQISAGGYKSTIVNTKLDQQCAECGECMAVCPVGALVSTDFKYSANAWELNKIPASCAHCSSGCQLYYEVKHESIDNPEQRIYRVTNEFEFSSLCGAGRFAFDYENRDAHRDAQKFEAAKKALKTAESVRFGAMITNEEALLLEKLRKKLGFHLVCDEAYGYQKFLDAYQSISGTNLYQASLKDIADSRVIIVFGTRIYDDNPMVKYHMAMASKRHKARIAYMHPIEDSRIQNLTTQFVKYEVGSEEGVAALLASTLLREKKLPAGLSEMIENLDIGNLSAESNVGEEELDALLLSLWKKKDFTLIIGADLYDHPEAESIARWIAAIEKYSDFRVMIIPPATNARGVAEICTLSRETEGYVVGYNAPGDFVLSALGGGDLDMPALNQQEGTLTTVDQRIVPTHPALPYNGYTLNELANTFGIGSRHTIDQTVNLPREKGFEGIGFDDLPDYFDPVGKEHRGYLLKETNRQAVERYQEPDELPTYDGVLVYRCNEQNSFNPFGAKCTQMIQKAELKGSAQFAMAAKLKDGQTIRFEDKGVSYTRVFRIDTMLKGTVAVNPTWDIGLSAFALSSYRFSHLKFEIIGNDDEQ
jgi:NADH-quinone oxidoreductase subunit G